MVDMNWYRIVTSEKRFPWAPPTLNPNARHISKDDLEAKTPQIINTAIQKRDEESLSVYDLASDFQIPVRYIKLVMLQSGQFSEEELTSGKRETGLRLTPEEQIILEYKWNRGVSFADIAEEFNITQPTAKVYVMDKEKAVRIEQYRNKPWQRRLTIDQEKDIVRQFEQENTTLSALGKEYKIKSEVIKKILQEHGVLGDESLRGGAIKGQGSIPTEKREEIIRIVRQDIAEHDGNRTISNHVVGKLVGVSHQTVRRVLTSINISTRKGPGVPPLRINRTNKQKIIIDIIQEDLETHNGNRTLTNREIGRRTGISRSTVDKVVSKMDIPTPLAQPAPIQPAVVLPQDNRPSRLPRAGFPTPDESDIQVMKALRLEGKMPQDIVNLYGKKFGLTADDVMNFIGSRTANRSWYSLIKSSQPHN